MQVLPDAASAGGRTLPGRLVQQPVEYPLARSLTRSTSMMVSTGDWDDGQKQQLQEKEQFFQEAQLNPFRPQSSEQTSRLHTSLNQPVSSINLKLPLNCMSDGPSSSLTSDLQQQSQGISATQSSDRAAIPQSLLTYKSIRSARHHTASDAPVFTPVASTVSPSERMFTVSRAAADGISAFPGPYRSDSLGTKWLCSLLNHLNGS